MKGEKVETESVVAQSKQALPSPPPPPPPLPSFWVRKPTITESVTNREIAKFWRQKRIEEEDHLLAAIKAAARIRARSLSIQEEDYKRFEESLKDEDKEKSSAATNCSNNYENSEVHVGIKDWWTKSKYAYLNQPAIECMEPPKRRSSNYVPNCFTYKPIPLYPNSLGVF
ncbi:hypothetical protein CFOL_v3_05723 [Cephalotus follicularis]|uniref:Uncharacterized protein n=1 Tax=Cephalotus follicularis TaxID=3775 RepID=A0A1Q3B2K8_CEPFO|nr:hypothetical protein CFOL_v3_05723 [Cephalotus follicularis]